MASAEELLAREQTAWDAMWAQVERVSEDDRMREGVVGDWSTQDVVWHCAYWANFCGEHLEAMSAGPWSDPFGSESDEYWDRMNQDITDASKEMTWTGVVVGSEAARVRVRSAMAAFTDVGDVGKTWFADETFIHYDEHAEQIAAFADASSV